jgi:hypothetical protein
MDTIEAELARLTARTEEVELKLNRVVSDGTNRIGDIEYRVCEVTEGCDPTTLGATPTLGGDARAAAPAPLATDTVVTDPGPARAGRSWRWRNRQTLTGPRRCSVQVTFAVLQSSLRPMPNPILADR